MLTRSWCAWRQISSLPPSSHFCPVTKGSHSTCYPVRCGWRLKKNIDILSNASSFPSPLIRKLKQQVGGKNAKKKVAQFIRWCCLLLIANVSLTHTPQHSLMEHKHMPAPTCTAGTRRAPVTCTQKMQSVSVRTGKVWRYSEDTGVEHWRGIISGLTCTSPACH